jgi:transposase
MRLFEQEHLSQRKIAEALNISRPTVKEYLDDFQRTGMTYEQAVQLPDDELIRILTKDRRTINHRLQILAAEYEHIGKELTKPKTTLYLLWEEYKQRHPDGFQYTQFCEHFNRWNKNQELWMHQEYSAGDKMFADYAGDTLSYIDRMTGAAVSVEMFVAILPASQRIYAEACMDQKKETFVAANENAFWYYGGVPRAVVPDNLKSAVTKADRYEPEINWYFERFASHYGTVVLPARARKPRDKALVESAVNIVYARIYAKLRNEQFYSLAQLNARIRELLLELNQRLMQRLKQSREERFLEIEKQHLRPLPAQRMHQSQLQMDAKVWFHYHVHLLEDRHFYSVPARYRGMYANIIFDGKNVEIYVNNERIATHRRDRTKNGYTTDPTHMPPTHAWYAEWTPERFLSWAQNIGSETKQFIDAVLNSRKHPEQAFRTCLGVLKQKDTFGAQRLNNACRIAASVGVLTAKKTMDILLRKIDLAQAEQTLPLDPPRHENIRGAEAYVQRRVVNE